MPKKTNKTSHILDLITNGAPAEPGSAQDQDSAGEKTSEQRTRSSASKKVKVVDETSRNDRVSGEILSGLAKELKEELGLDEAPGSRAPGSDINETPDGDSSVQGSLVADGSTPSTPDINA
ncbi:MAG: hypothetical protein LIP16_05630, partial [Clostridium sp.]|nr:hypothetical protein [Clostridium sp.]